MEESFILGARMYGVLMGLPVVDSFDQEQRRALLIIIAAGNRRHHPGLIVLGNFCEDDLPTELVKTMIWQRRN
jgi:hypothetical protein